MYWQGAFPGLSFETQPQLGDVPIDKEGLRGEIQSYMNGLQRYLALTGLTAKTLSPTVVDPTSQIQVHLQAIAIRLGIPMRILMGSERGELASGQDDDAWNDRIKLHQKNHVTPIVVCAFVDTMINVGVLPEPDGYYVKWPDVASVSESQRLDVATKKTTILGQYTSGQMEMLMAPMDFFTKILGMNLQVKLVK
jgi:hypothetical protein